MINETDLQAGLDEKVRNGLMEKTASGGYRLTEKGASQLEARPTGGAWVWVEMTVLLRNYERALAEALLDAGVAAMGASSFHALLVLYQNAPQKASDIARAIGLPATSFTPVLDRLEELDLIVRRASALDRRAVLIHLTQKGEALRERLVPLAQHLNETLWQKTAGLV
jgi:DNA-binding MarR family transcriptional regulator